MRGQFDRLRRVGGLDPFDLPGGERGQWDDGGNALAIWDRVTICDERNIETNERLADAGFEVVTVPWRELGGARGGPRCMCAPVLRDPAVIPADEMASQSRGATSRPLTADGDNGVAHPDEAAPAGSADGWSRRAGELAPA